MGVFACSLGSVGRGAVLLRGIIVGVTFRIEEGCGRLTRFLGSAEFRSIGYERGVTSMRRALYHSKAGIACSGMVEEGGEAGERVST